MEGAVTLLEPAWLALAIPLGFAFVRWLPASPARRLLRAGLFAVLVLALARPAVVLPRPGGTLVAVVDRSASMPADGDEVAAEVLSRLASARRPGDRLAVVSFAARAAIETAGETPFQGFAADVGRQGSDLAAAVDAALGLVPPASSSRLLLVTDGRWTGRDPSSAAARSAMQGVELDYRLLERPATGDVAVERLEAPGEASPGEVFLISAWVRSPVRQEVEVSLRRGERVLASGRRRVGAGLSRFDFRERAAERGVHGYSVAVRPIAGTVGEDPVPENDVARFLVGIRGPRPVLVASGAPTRTAALLEGGGLDVRVAGPGSFPGTLAELAAYSAVVLEDLPADEVGELAMENLASWVRSAGGGLMMTGGRRSFGPGGYFRSPLEDVLPVSMELRQEHRKVALAMVVALDRSGSMAVAVEGGRTKMDLADLAAAEVLDMLSPFDEFGVVAVDSSPHVILPLAPVEETGAKRQRILAIDSQGGGIFVFVALREAVTQLLRSPAGDRHVLLFADAADAEEPGAYRELLERCRETGITVSVVGLGEPTDVDAELLRDVARRGGGRVFFTASPAALPRIFAQDTFEVARSTFVEQETPFRLTAGLKTLSGRAFTAPAPLGGYNLTYLRPGAELAAVTRDEYEAPVVAAWQAGLGRALAYTGEVDGAASGAVAGWPDFGALLASLVRWTAGESNELPRELLVTQELRRGALLVRLHLDPERQGDPFVELPRLTTLSGVPGRPPESQRTDLAWSDPDTLQATVELAGDEVAMARVEVPGVGGVSLAPVRLPYAPEYAPAEPAAGQLALERLARTTGGRRRLDVADVWRDFERRPRTVEMGPWLAGLAALLLLVEVLERRTALLSGRWAAGWAWSPRGRRGATSAVAPEPRRRAPVSSAPAPPVAKQGEDASAAEGVLTALDRARRRAERRTRR